MTESRTAETASPSSRVANDDQPVSLRLLSRVPLVPQPILAGHDCFISTDTRYRAAARLRQSLWRAARGFSLGTLRSREDPEAEPFPLGSRIGDDAGRHGANFIAPGVHALVRREVAMCEEGALIEAERLASNLLSSTALVFNLLGPLALDPELATTVLRSLLPGFVHVVTAIRFETSPGRGDPRYLADFSAFDAAVEIVTPDGEPGTIFIELKYTEGLHGPAATARPRYDDVSRGCGLFVDPESSTLRTRSVEQFWRLHMLAGLAVRHCVTPRAIFVAISPALNRRTAAALTLYAAELVEPEPLSDDRVGFVALTLERVVTAIANAGDHATAAALTERYLDFQPVLDVVLADDRGPRRDPPVASVRALPAPSSAARPPEASSPIKDADAAFPAAPSRRRQSAANSPKRTRPKAPPTPPVQARR